MRFPLQIRQDDGIQNRRILIAVPFNGIGIESFTALPFADSAKRCKYSLPSSEITTVPD